MNATFIDVDGISHAYHPLEHFLLVLCQELASPQHIFLGMILLPTISSIGSVFKLESAGLLVKQLSGIKIDDEAIGVVQRLLPPNSKDSAPSFLTSPRKAGTKRLERFSLPSNSSESREKSYLLLLIRSAK